jgi:hypothetical protein
MDADGIYVGGYHHMWYCLVTLIFPVDIYKVSCRINMGIGIWMLPV